MKHNKNILVTRKTHKIYVLRTNEEIVKIRNADISAGITDDGRGEPIIYGPYSGWNHVDCDELLLSNIRIRNITWESFNKKPKGIRAGFSELLDREVLFLDR